MALPIRFTELVQVSWKQSRYVDALTDIFPLVDESRDRGMDTRCYYSLIPSRCLSWPAIRDFLLSATTTICLLTYVFHNSQPQFPSTPV